MSMYLIPAEAGCWTFLGKCAICQKDYVTQPFSEQGWSRYKEGHMIQDALPELSSNDREFILSRICPSCFDKLFKEEDMKMKTKEQWEKAREKEREDDIHPCDHWHISKCMCKGACSCHWVQPTKKEED